MFFSMPRHNLLQPFFDYLFVLLEQLADAKERDDLLRKLLNALHMPYTSPLLQLALQQNMERFLGINPSLSYLCVYNKSIYMLIYF